MDKKEIEDKIIDIISVFLIDDIEISNGSLLKEDLGLDSMTIVNLVLDINNDFNISIKSNEIIKDNFYSISNLVDFISRKINNN